MGWTCVAAGQAPAELDHARERVVDHLRERSGSRGDAEIAGGLCRHLPNGEGNRPCHVQVGHGLVHRYRGSAEGQTAAGRVRLARDPLDLSRDRADVEGGVVHEPVFLVAQSANCVSDRTRTQNAADAAEKAVGAVFPETLFQFGNAAELDQGQLGGVSRFATPARRFGGAARELLL